MLIYAKGYKPPKITWESVQEIPIHPEGYPKLAIKIGTPINLRSSPRSIGAISAIRVVPGATISYFSSDIQIKVYWWNKRRQTKCGDEWYPSYKIRSLLHEIHWGERNLEKLHQQVSMLQGETNE